MSTQHSDQAMTDESRQKRDRRRRTERAKPQSELGLRVATSVIYVAVILVCLWLGRLTTTLLVMAMSCMCCIEFFQLMKIRGRMPNSPVGLGGAILFPLIALIPGEWRTIAAFVYVVAIGIWYVFTPRANVLDVAVTVLGSLYTGLLFSAFFSIRCADPGFPGALLTLGVLGSVWANDAVAYLFGTKFGRHKMIPKVSPNKSWEGFVAGMLASVAVWSILAALHVCGLTWPEAVIAAILVGVAGVLGDLTESRIKRGVGVKDSGNLMPGHGGMLDRSDSLLFATFAARALLSVWGII